MKPHNQDSHMIDGVIYFTDTEGNLWYWHTSFWQRVRRFFGFSCHQYPRPVGKWKSDPPKYPRVGWLVRDESDTEETR